MWEQIPEKYSRRKHTQDLLNNLKDFLIELEVEKKPEQFTDDRFNSR